MSNQPNTISINIENSDTVLYTGEVKAVTCINDKGAFDVLPFHANFISLIKDKIIIHESSGRDKEIDISQGVMKVINNKIAIFVGIS